MAGSDRTLADSEKRENMGGRNKTWEAKMWRKFSRWSAVMVVVRGNVIFKKKDYHHFSVCGYLLGTESHVGSWVAHKSSFHIIDDAESSHHKTQSRLISKYQSGSWMNVKVVKWCWKKWCTTNNVESCTKFNGKSQTANFTVFTRGHRWRQELFPENDCFLRKLKRVLLKILKWHDLSRVDTCERARPEDSENLVVKVGSKSENKFHGKAAFKN